MELMFVGEQRQRVVDELVTCFDQVTRKKSPLWVSLEAGAGWGKTRLVQEFYKRLAAAQNKPPYWPSSILSAVHPRERTTLNTPEGRRKRIYPAAFTPPPDATPTWFWWGISAARRKDGTPFQALADDLTQIEAHTPGLERRWREVAGRGERIKDLLRRDEARQVGRTLGEEGLGAAVEAIANTAVPGLGLLVLAGEITWRQRDRWRQRATAPSAVDAAGSHRTDLVAELARSIGAFASAGIPIVIAVEDVHDADQSLTELLVHVVTQRRGPVLIITTAWPGTLQELDRPAHVLLEELPASSRHSPALEESRLTDDDLLAIAAQLLPHGTTAALGHLAIVLDNPLAIELASTLPRIRQAAQDPAAMSQELLRLPRDVHALYRDVWRTLPRDLRETLMLAALSTPEAISGLLSDRTWGVNTLKAAAQTLPWLGPSTRVLARQIDEDGMSYGWVRHVDESLRSFHDPVQFDVVTEEALDQYPSRSRADLYQAIVEHLHAPPGDLSAEAHAHRARTLVSLAAEGFTPWGEQEIEAADQLIAESSQLPHVDAARAVISLASAVPSTDPDPRSFLRRSRLAEALRRVGRLAPALNESRALLQDFTRLRGPNHPDTLTFRHNLAFLLGEAGQLDEAILHFRKLLDETTRVKGPDHPHTLIARNNLATWLSSAGLLKEATAQFRTLLDDRTRVLGPDHADTLVTRAHLASCVARSGRVGEAIHAFQTLLDQRISTLGPDHSDTLATREQLATWLTEAGFVEEAIGMYRTLLDDHVRVLGPEHPETLTTRHNLAWALSESGQVEDAIEQSRTLLDERLRLLGPDHPTTLSTRHNFASLLSMAGQPKESIAQLTQLLDAQARILGPAHPDTLASRGSLGFALGMAGRAEEAIALFQALIDDLVRTLGPEHPDNLIARGNLVTLLYEVGRRDEAIDQCRVLLNDRLRILGPSHPRTLDTQNALAAWLSETDRPKDTIDQLSALVSERMQLLGPDDQGTLSSREDVVIQLMEAGRHAEAIDHLHVLLDDRTRIEGPGHPHTLRTRHELGCYLLEVGRADDAVDQFSALAADCGHTLGPDHHDTLSARGNLTTSLASAGRIEEAIDGLNALIGDRERMVGADDPDTLTLRSNLATWLNSAGRVDEAINELHELLAHTIHVLGADHPDTVHARLQLALWQQEAGQVKEAAAQLLTVVDDFSRILGSEHPYTEFARKTLDAVVEQGAKRHT